LEIENFKSGLVCPDRTGDVGKGWICFETEDVAVTGQGRCTYNGEEAPCTWYGFQFDYRNAGSGERISCVTTSSEPIYYGDPDNADEAAVTTKEWAFELEPGSGRYYNPQYSLSAPQRDQTLVSDETVCSANDGIIFRYKIRTTYPT
jgi:hypothetical protein